MIRIELSSSNYQADKLQELFGAFGNAVNAPGNVVLQNTTETGRAFDAYDVLSFVIENVDDVAVAVFSNWLFETLKAVKKPDIPQDTPIELVLIRYDDGKTMVVRDPEMMVQTLTKAQKKSE